MPDSETVTNEREIDIHWKEEKNIHHEVFATTSLIKVIRGTVCHVHGQYCLFFTTRCKRKTNKKYTQSRESASVPDGRERDNKQ